MVKRWQRACNVPIQSFMIDVLVSNFMPSARGTLNNRALEDYLVRDFFAYLVLQANSFILMPGTGASRCLRDDWLSRAQSAYARASKASDYEVREMPISAVAEWQKIFGTDIR